MTVALARSSWSMSGPRKSTGIAPKDLKYRFAWTFPIVFSPHDRNMLYAGGNHVFRTRDEGMSWEEISPDLSLNDVSRQGHSGGEITRESAGAEVHATCACVVENRRIARARSGPSTDDGLVHVTRDDGNVLEQRHPARDAGRSPMSAASRFRRTMPDTIYLAATRYKLADYRPYLFRSIDGGRSWQSINR